MIKLKHILKEQIIDGAPSIKKVKKVKRSLTTDRDYVYSPVREQNTAELDQQIRKAESLPLVQRIAMINQIRKALGENTSEGKIQGFHTLQEDGIAKINGHEMGIEIQSTPEGLERGLMFKKEIPSGKGMLLKFGKDHPAKIWMKNVKQPLDIIYIKDDQVEDLFKNAMPDMGDGIFDSIGEVICDMVLELPAGDIEKFDIKPGDMFGFNDLRKTHVNEDESNYGGSSWQAFRKKMKGKATSTKLNMLANADFPKKVEDNYRNALRRGGQLPAKKS